MSILHITNLTDNPVKMITNRYLNAFEQIENSLSTDEIDNYIDNQISNLIERAEETKGKDLMSLVDNFLINNDYFEDVEDFITNK